MSIKTFLRKRMERSNEVKDMEKDLRVQQMVEERMKSPEEREIIKHLESERKDLLKEEVKSIRAKATRNFFSAGIMNKENIFKNHPKILTLDSNSTEKGMFF